LIARHSLTLWPGLGNAKNAGFTFREFAEFTAQLSEDRVSNKLKLFGDLFLDGEGYLTDRVALAASRKSGAAVCVLHCTRSPGARGGVRGRAAERNAAASSSSRS
jgi:hypothetical protein